MKNNIYQLIKRYNRTVQKLNNTHDRAILAIQKLYKKTTRLASQIFSINHFKKLKLSLMASGLIAIGAHQSQAQVSFDSTLQANPYGITQLESVWSQPTFVDLDGDGDLDITDLSSVGEFYFLENIGTAAVPSYAPRDTNLYNITDTLSYPNHDFVDLDNDGDLDLFIHEYGSLGTFWYKENIGSSTSPNFGVAQQNPFNLVMPNTQLRKPAFVDLDNDGDFDLMMGNYAAGFTYFENTGTATSPSFAAAVSNPFGLSIALGVYMKLDFADLDQDGDMDLMTGVSFYDDTKNLLYFENTGTATAPNFASAVTNPFGLPSSQAKGSCSFGDIDNDGDMDILSVHTYQDLPNNPNIWLSDYLIFENTSLISSSNFVQTEKNLSIYPNPVQHHLNIKAPQSTIIQLFDALGKEVFTTRIGAGTTELDLSELPKGIYFLRSSDAKTVQKIIKG
jgi:hypothetical protein